MDSSNPPFTTLTPALEGCELAIISGALAHHQFLARQAYPGVQVVILGQPGAGLAAVTAALQQWQPVRRLHLVTPGQPGQLVLGHTPLTHKNLAEHAPALWAWRSLLSPSAEMVLYGHRLASNEAGRQLLDLLHHVTGAAIAACATLPTPRDRHGHWEWDYTRSGGTPRLAFPAWAIAASLQPAPPPGHARLRIRVGDRRSGQSFDHRLGRKSAQPSGKPAVARCQHLRSS